MRDSITTSIKQIAQSRALMTVLIVLIVLSALAALYFGVRVKPSDIQVTTHYTSYGGVNFYTSPWWYAVSFALFFVAVAALHTAIAVKLFTVKGKAFAVGFGWFSVGLVAFAVLTLTYIVNVAFPL